MQSKIEPFKIVAKMPRKHKALILNWVKRRSRLANEFNKAKLTIKKCYSFKSYEIVELAL